MGKYDLGLKGKKSGSKDLLQKSSSSRNAADEFIKINRNQIFYCTHFNRHAGFFNKFYLTSYSKDSCLKEISSKILKGVKIKNEALTALEREIRILISNIRSINFDNSMMRLCPLPQNYKELRNRVDQYKRKDLHTNETRKFFLYKF